MPTRTCLLVILLFILSSTAVAQGPESRQPKEPVSKSKAAKTAEVDALAAERRNVAISLLTSLADDARSFRDQKLRARVLARTADALWTSEPERARELFRRAWAAAETGDADTARQAAEDARKQQQESGAVVRRSLRDTRSEVLRIVAKRDSKLAEEFLKKLTEDAEREAKEAAADADRKRATDQWGAPAGLAKRLSLARALLQDGDIEQAEVFAAPALQTVNRQSIGFLSALRQKSATADTFFRSLLLNAVNDPQSDANTVSGLSSYAFTPLLYVTFDATGGSYANQEGPMTGPPDLPPDLKALFFRVAGAILMRPLPPPDQDFTTSGRSGKFMVIKRLLPLFDQYSPDQAALLRTEMTALSANLSDPNIAEGNRAIDRGIVPDNPATDPLQSMQNRLDHAKTSAERDGIYADVASSLAGKGDPQSRELASKIEDSEFRKQTIAYVDFELMNDAFRKKDIAELVRIAKTGELTHIQRVWGYAQAARLVTNTDAARATDYLQEATTEARRIDGGDTDRARGLMAVATGFARTERARAWDIISEAVKVANGSEGFTGEDGTLSARLVSKSMVVSTNSSAEDFDVAGVFTLLAGDDLYRSIELAKTFGAETARANATIAIARSVLEQKQKPKADKK
jgi:chemotaxis protein histidine kinase CheA